MGQQVHLVLDDDTHRMLAEAAASSSTSKADLVRAAIRLLYGGGSASVALVIALAATIRAAPETAR